jgi:hypothetical protein
MGLDKSPSKAEGAATTMDADRLKGIKAAVTDLEAGKLKIRSAALPVAVWHETYLDVLQKECGIEWETVTEHTGRSGIELRGYNDVMIMEIEHRFGKGIPKHCKRGRSQFFVSPRTAR